jgi:hypothetical protein
VQTGGRADEHVPHADNPRVAAGSIASLTRVLAALCGAVALAAAAQEWRYDGAELAQFAADYEKLRDAGGGTLDPSLSARVGYFTGFVLGVARANADRGWYCLPDTLQAGQMWDAVAQFLRTYPSLAQAKPSTLVNGALAKSFPCSAAERAARKPAGTTRPKPKAQAKPAS